MSEWKLFEGEPPEWTRAEWYLTRERAPHLEQPGHGPRLRTTETIVRAVATQAGARSLVDLGCGDGGLLSLLQHDYDAWGYDLCPANVHAALDDRKVTAYRLDVVDDTEHVRWGDLAVATEMLEHLADPHGFARTVAANCRALVASSPADERPGRHYEYHAWAWDMDGYRRMIEQAGFGVACHVRAGPFQVIGAIRRDHEQAAA